MDIECKCDDCRFCFEGDCQLAEVKISADAECESYMENTVDKL